MNLAIRGYTSSKRHISLIFVSNIHKNEMKKENSNIFAEYFEYFLDGLKLFINEYPIIIGIFLFLIGIKGYMKMIEKKPIDYKTRPTTRETINEVRGRSVQWEWIIFIIILGISLILSHV
jgi:heme/copper-type cytochrome/quinol oxidase subunit 2